MSKCRREVSAVCDFVGARHIGHAGDRGPVLSWQGDFVSRLLGLVLDRLDCAQIRDNRARVAIRQVAIVLNWHGWTNDRAVRALAVADRIDDLIVGPITDASLLVGRDVGGDGVKDRRVDYEAPGQLAIGHWFAVAVFGRVAVAAGDDALHQISAAFQRRLRTHGQCRETQDSQ
jgi:hypothetical protein